MTRGASGPAGEYWYIPGRMGEVSGDFLMSESEFYAISNLFPLVANIQRMEQARVMKFGVTCMNREDARMVSIALAAIRSASHYEDTQVK